MKSLTIHFLITFTCFWSMCGYSQLSIKSVNRRSVEVTISNELSDTIYLVNPMTYATLHDDGEIILDEPILTFTDSSVTIFGDIHSDRAEAYNFTSRKIIPLVPGAHSEVKLLMYLPHRARKQFRKKRVGLKFIVKSGDDYVEKISYYEN